MVIIYTHPINYYYIIQLKFLKYFIKHLFMKCHIF